MIAVQTWSECVGYARAELSLRLQGNITPIQASDAVISAAGRWTKAYNRGEQPSNGNYDSLHNILASDARAILDRQMTIKVLQ